MNYCCKKCYVQSGELWYCQNANCGCHSPAKDQAERPFNAKEVRPKEWEQAYQKESVSGEEWVKEYLKLTQGWRSLADVSHNISPFAVQATLVFIRAERQKEYERGREEVLDFLESDDETHFDYSNGSSGGRIRVLIVPDWVLKQAREIKS